MKRVLSIFVAVVFLMASFNMGIYAANKAVKVETGKITKSEKDCTINVLYPIFSGFSSAADLNSMIQNKNTDDIGFINNSNISLMNLKEEIEKSGEQAPDLSVSLNSYFDYNFSGDILSVVTNTYEYAGGAHGMTYLNSYTANTITGELYTFGSLFNQNSDYKKIILDKINKLIDKEKDLYFEEAKQTVKDKNSDYQFYIDGSKLVIYFGLYELRPYAGGMSFFEIEAKELKGLLKDDVYKQIINAKPLGAVRFNGTNSDAQFKIYEEPIYTTINNEKYLQYNVYMVPLKSIAEALGYKVSWDNNKGAGVAGGFIKNNVNNYYTANSEKVKLKLPPRIINGSTYVPVEYFTQVLKEDVSYYDGALRIFKPQSEPGQFDRQIVNYVSPDTAEKCVDMFAKAVQSRNGALQYALLSDKLRAEKKADFEDLNWVTGVSSPWVTGYNIYEQKTESTKTFNIIFHWATSAGKVPDTKTIVTVEKDPVQQEFWEITSVVE